MRVEHRHLGVLLVREGPGQALVEDAAERVHVRAPVDRLPLDLLGRRVVHCPDEEAGAGEAAAALSVLRDPEVGQVRVLEARLLGDQHVRRA